MSPLSVLMMAVETVNDDEAAKAVLAALAGMWMMLACVGVLVFVFMLYLWWRIFDKAGFGGPWALLLLVPGFGVLIALLVLAFGDWPALKRPRDV